MYHCRVLVRRGRVFWVSSRKVRQLARPHGVEGLLLLLGPRRTARSGLRERGRLWARWVDLGKLGVLESRIGIVGVIRKLNNLPLGWRLRRRGGRCRANRIWDIGKLRVTRSRRRRRGKRGDIRKLRIDWTREDVFLITDYELEMKTILK